MTPRSENSRFGLCLFVSVLLHTVAGIIASDSGLLTASATPTAAANRLPMLPIVALPPPPEEERIKVGNPDSTADTMTWLGYNEAEEHITEIKAPIDQPALSFDPPAPAPSTAPEEIATPPVAMQPPAPPVPPAPPATPVPEPTPPTEPAEVARAPEEEEPAPLADTAKEATAPHTTPVDISEIVVDEGEDEAQQPTTLKVEPPIEAEPIKDTKPAEQLELSTSAPKPEDSKPDAPKDVPPEKSPTEPAPEHSAPSPELQIAPQTNPAPTPSPLQPEQGTKADREADVASTKTAAQVHLGKPLAANGLRIRTVRPKSSHYNAMLARCVDPVIRVHFDRRGKVQLVEFLRKSENRDVDMYVMNAAYQWTAEGKALDELPATTPPQPEATIAVDFVIVRPLSG